MPPAIAAAISAAARSVGRQQAPHRRRRRSWQADWHATKHTPALAHTCPHTTKHPPTATPSHAHSHSEQVPCDPKMLLPPYDAASLASFRLTSLERELKRDMLLEADLGIPITPWDVQRYAAPDRPPPLDPADAALLRVRARGGGEQERDAAGTAWKTGLPRGIGGAGRGVVSRGVAGCGRGVLLNGRLQALAAAGPTGR